MSCSSRILLAAAGCVAGLSVSLATAAEPVSSPEHPSPDAFAPVGQAVLELLQTRDTAAFAKALAPRMQDYHSIVSTNRLADDKDPSKAMGMTQAFQQRKVEQSAKAALQRMDQLHLQFTNGNWRAIPNVPEQFSQMHWSNLQEEGEFVPALKEVEFVLTTNATAASSDDGEFTIALQGMVKFPAGWRSREGLRWTAFPASVAGADTARELALLKKVSRSEGFSDKQDPALRKFGEGLIHFLRERDTNVFAQQLLFSTDLLWEQLKKNGGAGRSRQEFDQEMGARIREKLTKAGELAQQMAAAGIDLKDAQVQLLEAAVEHSQSQGSPGSLDGVMARGVRVRLAVKSSRNSSSGTPLSGTYVLAASQIMRFGDQWRLMSDVHWQSLPEGIVDAKTVAAMNLENYVTEHGTLPPGQPAPDIEFQRLSDGQPMKLSALRGKVVVLDFWATWCGPCQGPMAELQKLPAAHPAWQDKVAIVPLSIDDTIAAVRSHVEKRGWTNTFNVWAGDGGWRAAPPQAFRVTGVPTTYILDAEGKIVHAGHPAAMDIPAQVNALLGK